MNHLHTFQGDLLTHHKTPPAKIILKTAQKQLKIEVNFVLFLNLRQRLFYPDGNARQNKNVFSYFWKVQILGAFHVSATMPFHRTGEDILKAMLQVTVEQTSCISGIFF